MPAMPVLGAPRSLDRRNGAVAESRGEKQGMASSRSRNVDRRSRDAGQLAVSAQHSGLQKWFVNAYVHELSLLDDHIAVFLVFETLDQFTA